MYCNFRLYAVWSVSHFCVAVLQTAVKDIQNFHILQTFDSYPKQKQMLGIWGWARVNDIRRSEENLFKILVGEKYFHPDSCFIVRLLKKYVHIFVHIRCSVLSKASWACTWSFLCCISFSLVQLSYTGRSLLPYNFIVLDMYIEVGCILDP